MKETKLISWMEQIIREHKENEDLNLLNKRLDAGQKFYETMPSYKMLFETSEYHVLMQEKHDVVYEKLINEVK